MELETNLREVLQSQLLLGPTSAFTFKNILRHYAEQAPKHGISWHKANASKIITDGQLKGSMVTNPPVPYDLYDASESPFHVYLLWFIARLG